MGVVVVAGVGFMLTRGRGGAYEQNAVRYALIGAVFALIGYDYLALGLPGSTKLLESAGVWASLVVTIGMGILGQTLWAVGSVVWRRIRAN